MLLIPRLSADSVYVCLCVCCQVVFEVAFNSARGGYVAIDDIAFSPEFCHTDTGENSARFCSKSAARLVENPFYCQTS